MVLIALSASILLAVISAYDDTSCPYYGTEEVATPLGACNSYSHNNEQYSYQFVCDEYGEVAINSFTDTECSQADFVSSVGDDEVGTSLQCIGSADNCHTVDITLTSIEAMGSCDDASDVATFHYVVDECIPSMIEGIEYSSLLSCDEEKLWLEYYVGCESCDCDGEQYTEIFYDDLPGCWDISCGKEEFSGIGGAETTPAPRKKRKCRRLNKESIQELTGMMTDGAGFKDATLLTAQKLMFKESVINGSVSGLYNKMAVNWIYIVAVLCAVVLLGGAWKLIKTKEYSMI